MELPFSLVRSWLAPSPCRRMPATDCTFRPGVTPGSPCVWVKCGAEDEQEPAGTNRVPVTPFHFGLGLLGKGVAPAKVSFLAFVPSQVAIDCDTAYFMLVARGWPLHRWA